MFPALLATCLLTTIAAAILLSPQMLAKYGLSLTGAVLSFSNIVFWSESGYWDEASYLKPLLHTWSLGVEEQFYYVWPALMMLGPALGWRRGAAPVLAALGIVSLLVNLVWVGLKFDPEYAATTFFWMPFRIYEFVLGGVGVFAVERWRKTTFAQEAGMAIGLLMIAISVITFTDKLIFPSFYALLPCVGALLVILSGQARRFGAVVRNPVAVWIGLISYSLYLVHWPVFVFYRYSVLQEPGAGIIALLILVTFVLAYLLHEWVETPFYKRGSLATQAPEMRAAFIPSSIGAMVVLALLGLQISRSDGWAWRQPTALTAGQVEQGKQQRYQYWDVNCSITDPKAPACKMDRPLQVLFIGNSHELDALNIFRAAYGSDDSINFIKFGTLNGCDVKVRNGVPVTDVSSRQCRERMAMLSSRSFVSKLDVVVYGSYRPFSHTKRPSFLILKRLKEMNNGIKFVVMGGYFVSGEPCAEVIARFGTAARCKDRIALDERDRSELKEKDLVDYLYIDKMKLLCPDGTIESCKFEAYGEPMFYDKHHLSFSFSRYVGEKMAVAYQSELAALGFEPKPQTTAAQHKGN